MEIGGGGRGEEEQGDEGWGEEGNGGRGGEDNYTLMMLYSYNLGFVFTPLCSLFI